MDAVRMTENAIDAGITPTKAAKSSIKSTSSPRSHSPILVISGSLRSSPVRLEGDEAEFDLSLPVLGCQTPASAPPRHAPSPIAWSAGGWNPGTFTFDLSSAGLSRHEEEDDEEGVEPTNQLARLTITQPQPSLAHSTQTDSDQPTISRPSQPKSNTIITQAAPQLKSKLAPTAAPFAFTPKVDPRPFPLAQDNSSTLPPILNQSPSALPFPAASAGSQAVVGHRFDEAGQLVGSEASYSIADEILAIQSLACRPLGPSRAQTFSGSAQMAAGHAQPDGGHRQQGSWQGSLGRSIGLNPSHVLAPTPPASVNSGLDYSRSRSASIGSSYFGSSYFPPTPGPDLLGLASPQRARELQQQAAAQLQSYFGPSTVEVNAPLGTYPPPPTTFYEPAQPGYGTLGSSSEPLDVSQTSPLYLAARETFVAHAVAGFDPVSAATASASLTAHFDFAMTTPHPLATLYGAPIERADELAASPASSGIDELVLRVAARRAGYRPASGELGGPSPSNKKGALWKTELCRSWEEKGSCRYGVKCQFAHSAAELRPVARHAKFKSENCRTFLTTGVCPYGARCVFRHSTEPDGPQTGSPQHGRSRSATANGLGEDPTTARSRLGLRTSSSNGPAAGFGPALASYLGPSAATATSTPSSSYPSSPVQDRFTPVESTFPSSMNMTSSQFGSEPRRFSTSVDVPSGQVPPQFAEAPQSRLQRLSTQRGMSRAGSVSSGSTATGGGGSIRTRASFESASALQQFALSAQQRNGNNLSSHAMRRQPSFTNPFAPIPGTPVQPTMTTSATAVPTTPRHGSTSSFGSFASSSGYASSFLPRQSSSSSLSSFTSSRDAGGILKPAGAEWLAAGGGVGGSGAGASHGSSLEWPEEGAAVEREATPRSAATLLSSHDPLLA